MHDNLFKSYCTGFNSKLIFIVETHIVAKNKIWKKSSRKTKNDETKHLLEKNRQWCFIILENIYKINMLNTLKQENRERQHCDKKNTTKMQQFVLSSITCSYYSLLY